MNLRSTVIVAVAAAAVAVAAHAASPIDVCAIVTKDDATKLLGPLPMQPAAETEACRRS